MHDDYEFMTDRLHARGWHAAEQAGVVEDLPQAVAAMLTEPVTRWLPPHWQGPYSRALAEAWIAERDAEGPVLLVWSRETAEPLGLLLMFEEQADAGVGIRIGYLLAEAAWGRGYGSELLRGFVAWCRERGDVRTISGGVAPENVASIQVLERQGFVRAAGAAPEEELTYTLQIDQAEPLSGGARRMERPAMTAGEGLPIIAVSRSALPGARVRSLSAIGQLREWKKERAPDRTELSDLCTDAVALICLNGDRIDGDFLDGLPRLRLVAVASAGYDTVDAAAAAERGVIVTNTPGVLHEATADLAFGLILAARRRIVEADRWVRAGRWQEAGLRTMLGYDVHGATIGIIGLGEIGEAVARRARGFGMRVIHHNRTRGDRAGSKWRPLDDLLAEADIVSIHLPISEATRGLIGARELGLMKPSATLVNTGRGGIIDEAALVAALRQGTIASAGLDVQATEPNPDPDDPLLSVENCVVLPHIGSATYAARAGMVDLAAANVEAFLVRGTPQTPVPESRPITGPS